MNNNDELRNDRTPFSTQDWKHFNSIEHSYFYIYFEVFLYFITLCVCFTAKHMVLTRSENKSWIFENAALFTHFSDIFRQENPKFFGCFRVGELVRSIRSIIQQFSFTFNSTKTIVFLMLRMRCQMRKRFVFVAYWCFPVTEDCFHRSFPSKTERFLPFSLDRKMRRKRLKTTCRPTFTGWST